MDNIEENSSPTNNLFSSTYLILLSQFIIGTIILFIITKFKLIWIICKTFPRDIHACIVAVKFMITLKIVQSKYKNVGEIFDATAMKYKNKICFYYEDQEWTYQQVYEMTNRVANYFANEGFKKGDTVALFMENRVEYVYIWLGLSKIGVIPALINTNQKGSPLQHSLQSVNCKAIIYGKELSASIEGIYNNDKYVTGLSLYYSGEQGNENILLPNSIDLDVQLKYISTKSPATNVPITLSDIYCYIYTSGTTGLPKAAIINHARYSMIPVYSHYFQGVKSSDRIYTTMPLYHTAAGCLGLGHTILFGNSIVIRKKFSASNFWKDCIRHECTVAQYIGELCRYLLAQPEGPQDKGHKIRLMIGNGLRPDIWNEFKNRFSIKNIAEFYGATEGNCNIVNVDGKMGAVGFVPRWIYPYFFMQLVKVDKTGEPIRDPKTNFLITCKPNEPGELISTISHGHAFRDFKGYADASSKKKKIIMDCFKKGDSAFRSGDVLVMDDYGYFYFKDRTGDTFRWKGENVSTAEVEAVISRICHMRDAAVYGVQIPGQDGRAGMAAIVDSDGTLDLDILGNDVKKQLPSYARPIFIRAVKHIDLTGTYKMMKGNLQTEGYDIMKIKDPIYLLSNEKYILVDENIYKNIISEKYRF